MLFSGRVYLDMIENLTGKDGRFPLEILVNPLIPMLGVEVKNIYIHIYY